MPYILQGCPLRYDKRLHPRAASAGQAREIYLPFTKDSDAHRAALLFTAETGPGQVFWGSPIRKLGIARSTRLYFYYKVEIRVLNTIEL